MPAQPAYFHRLTEALEVLRALSSEWIDRRTLQEILGVSKTVAWRILRQCGGKEGPGSTLVCGREELIAALQRLQATGRYQYEIRRRARVEGHLAELLSVARSRHIRVAPEDRGVELLSTRFTHLPPGIDLSPTRLTIDFAGTEDFMGKLGAVMFALQNDYDSISSFLEAQRSSALR